MDTNIVLTIIGIVLSLIGIIFISIPKVVNEKTMSHIPSDAVGISALFRAANGGLGLALGVALGGALGVALAPTHRLALSIAYRRHWRVHREYAPAEACTAQYISPKCSPP